MIHPADTGPRTEFPAFLLNRTELPCTVGSITGPLGRMDIEFRFEDHLNGQCDLYVDPRFYQEARTLIWWSVPPGIHINIIPLEFTS